MSNLGLNTTTILTGIGVIIFFIVLFITTAAKRRTPKATPSQLWMNGTYAVAIRFSAGDINCALGGVRKGEVKQGIISMLASDWGIYNKSDAIKMIGHLSCADGMHNFMLLTFAENEAMYDLTAEQYEEKLNTLTDEKERLKYQVTYEAIKCFGQQAIMAWDLSRAVFLCAKFYEANYMTYEEALEQSLTICKQIQILFQSWDDFNKSYIYGYRFWMYTLERAFRLNSYKKRIDIINAVAHKPNSPFALAWNMELKKDW